MSISPLKATWAKAVLADAEKQKQEGIQGKWQFESPFKEVLEQIKKSIDMSCNAHLMRRAYSTENQVTGEATKVAHWR